MLTMRLFGLENLFKRKPRSGPGENTQADSVQEPDDESLPESSFYSDEPVSSKAEDRFGRAPFATRIAETLANRRDTASLVVGLYGPWGDGKTSTLGFVDESLRSYKHVVTVRFNPWYFGTQEQLLRGFFATLAEALGRSLSTRREEIGDLLSKYGGILSIASGG